MHNFRPNLIGISKLIYTCNNLHVPQSFPIMAVNSFLINFVWNFLLPKLKGTTMIYSIKNGGHTMPDMF